MENSSETIGEGMNKRAGEAAAKSETARDGGAKALPYSMLSLSKRNFFTWAAVLFAALSFAARITYYSPIREGAEGAGIGTFWLAALFIALPGLCYLSFTLRLVFEGERRLYKTSRAVLLCVVFLAARALCLLKENQNGVSSGLIAAALIVFYAVCAFLYRLAVNTGGRRRNTDFRRILALIVLCAAFIAEFALVMLPLLKKALPVARYLAEASILLNILALVSVLLGGKKIESEHPLPMAGDRRDGRRIRSLDPMNSVAVYIMNERNTANNLFADSAEISKTELYIRQKREQGLESFGYTHIMLAAYARALSQRPGMNRFISGQRIYSREDRFEVSMAVKKDMSLEGSETIISILLSPEDTPETVYEKFNREVEAAKGTAELNSSFDKLAGLVNYIPGVLMKFTVWFFKLLDYFGLLPNIITRLSPFHGSIFVTSMGSLGIRPVYHHLYNFGNIPIFLAFGMKRTENELQPDGSVVKKKYIDFTVDVDERICDGYYFASAFKLFKRCVSDPARLDEPPESIVWDIE